MKTKQGTAALLLGLFLLIAAVTGIFFVGAEDGDDGVCVWVCPTDSFDDGSGWGVYLSRELFGVTAGERMALLLTLTAPTGYEWERIETGEGARGLTLTVGEPFQGEVSVLLDGTVAEAYGDTEAPILRLFLRSGGSDPSGGSVGVTAGKYGELAIYCLRKDGGIVTVPLVLCTAERHGARDCESEEGSYGGDEATGIPETEACTESTVYDGEGGQTEPPDQADRDMEIPQNRFMGCRETDGRDGSYTVQFLFYGDGWDPPVICAEGRGVLTLEIRYGKFWDDPVNGEEGGRWSFCTFRGLSADVRYVFWVYTQEGTVMAVYEDGGFRGFGEIF